MRKTLWIAGALTMGAVACNNGSTATPMAGENAENGTVHNTSGTVETPLANAPGNNGAKPSDPIASATNRDKVVQYPDEIAMAPQPAKLVTGEVTFVRDAFRANRESESIATIPTGVTVNEVARRGDYYLILYPDPNDSTKAMAGWVYKDALESAAWPMLDVGKAGTATDIAGTNAKTPLATDTTKLSCKSGDSQLRTDRDFCARECKKDGDCKSSDATTCDGVAREVKGSKVQSAAVRYCVGSPQDIASPSK